MQFRTRTSLTEGFLGFAVISGLGWCLDMGLTVGLVELGLAPFWGSAVGAATAVSAVYVASRLLLLGDRRIGATREFGLYVVWQIAAISAASAVVAILAHALSPVLADLAAAGPDPLALAAGVAKAVVTPLTLLANFLFLRWLTERGKPGAPGAAKRGT